MPNTQIQADSPDFIWISILILSGFPIFVPISLNLSGNSRILSGLPDIIRICQILSGFATYYPDSPDFIRIFRIFVLQQKYVARTFPLAHHHKNYSQWIRIGNVGPERFGSVYTVYIIQYSWGELVYSVCKIRTARLSCLCNFLRYSALLPATQTHYLRVGKAGPTLPAGIFLFNTPYIRAWTNTKDWELKKLKI